MSQKKQSVSGSRRTFLRQSAAAVVGGTLAANLGSARSAHAAGSDLLKVGLIGCGGRGTGAASQALRADDNTQLVAVADAFGERTEGCLRNLKKANDIADKIVVDEDHTFVGLDGYQHVIESSDVVLLCSPPGFRPRHLRAAVEAGKHIFTEKPMATDSPGVRSVMESVAMAKKKDLALLAGFCWRYSNPKRALFDRILDGQIGEVRAVYGTYLTGPVKPMPPADKRPAGMSDLEWMVRNWYNFAWLSGDGLVEQACHTVDWLAWAMGDVAPASCTALGGRQIPSEGGDIFDHVEINYVWPNQARAFLAQRQIRGCFGQNSLYVLGTKGSADLTRGSNISDLAGERVWKYDGSDKTFSSDNMYQAEHDEFFASLRSGKHINDGDRMARSTLMAIMGRMAGYSGQEMTWEAALNSETSIAPAAIDGWDSPVEFREIPQPGRSKPV